MSFILFIFIERIILKTQNKRKINLLTQAIELNQMRISIWQRSIQRANSDLLTQIIYKELFL